MINVNSFRQLQSQLNSRSNSLFTVNKDNNSLTKKNNLDKHFHYQICSLPHSNLPIEANSSYLSILFFFNKATLIIDHKKITCMPYSIVFIKKGCRYRIEQYTTDDGIFIFSCNKCFFGELMLSQIADCPIFYDLLMLKEGKNEYLLFDYQKDTTILLTLHLLFTELIQYKNLIHSNKNYKLLLVLLISQLDRNHINYLVIHDSSMLPYYAKGRILKYLSDNFCTATLSSTAEFFNFHPTYFSALFKKLFNESFSKKLLSLKLEHSKRLLITTDMTVQEIMYCVGFNDKSYFFKCFKNYYQLTPIQYRKSHIKLYDNHKKND